MTQISEDEKSTCRYICAVDWNPEDSIFPKVVALDRNSTIKDLREEVGKHPAVNLSRYLVHATQYESRSDYAPVFSDDIDPVYPFPKYTMVQKSGKPIQVHVQTLKGQILDIDCYSDSEVSDLVKLVREKDEEAFRNPDGPDFTLLFKGQSLHSVDNLTRCGIRDVSPGLSLFDF